MKVSLGPILYYWPKNTVLDFYEKASKSDADVIYIGETVCSKRRELKTRDWIDLAKALSIGGKQIVLSTMALLEATSELKNLKTYCDNGDILVEANDMGAVHLLAQNSYPFVVGSAINCYNPQSLKLLQSLGMVRWVMPVELSRDWLLSTLAECENLGIRKKFSVEVLGYGHIPLAYSARCFTARSENRAKDDCQLCCINYPNGRQMHTQEHEELFVLNGIQTLSGKCQNLVNDVNSMSPYVDIVRLSPQSIDTLKWIKRFKDNHQSQTVYPLHNQVNGYWHNIEGMNIHR